MLPVDYTIKIVLIAGDKGKTGMLQATGVLESFKVLGTVETIEMSSGSPFDDAYLEKVIGYIAGEAVKNGSIVSACFVKGRSAGAYVNPSVKAVSDGSRWVALDAILKAHDYTPPANVKEVS